MAVSLLVAAIAGLTFGVLAALGTGIAHDRWPAVVQAHGELQLWGWFAVFIAALMFEFMVRFNGRPPVPLMPRAIVLALMGGGAMLSSAGRFLDAAPALVGVGAASIAGGALWLAVIVARIRPARSADVGLHPLFFRTGAVWLLLSALVGLIAARTVVSGATSFEESHLAAEVYLRGFAMNVTFAVALRAFVGHLGLPPMPLWRQRTLWGLVNISVVVWAAASPGFGRPGIPSLMAVGDLLFAAGILWATWALGIGRAVTAWSRRPDRAQVLAPIAWLGLLVYAVSLGGQAQALLTGGVTATFYQSGATRHMLALGFIAPLFIAMSHVVLERFLIGQLFGARWLTAAFALLMVAWPMRTVPPLLDGSVGEISRAAIAIAGVLTACALLIAAAVVTQNAVAADRYVRMLRRAERKRPERAHPVAADRQREAPGSDRRTHMHEIDVRADIAAGREPFPRIMAALNSLAPGEALQLIAPFEPVPLYTVLDQRGLDHRAESQAEGVWCVTIQRSPAEGG